MNSDEYLAAFMSGFEFVLLGIQGRVHGAELDAEARARVLAFIADYQRIVVEYRGREAPRVETPPTLALLLSNRN